MRERTTAPHGPRGRERVGGKIPAYDESLLHAGKRPTDTPQERARRGWQGCSLLLRMGQIVSGHSTY